MAEEPQLDSSEVSFIQIVVDGLRKSLDFETEETYDNNNGTFTERVSLPSNARLSALLRKLTGLPALASCRSDYIALQRLVLTFVSFGL